MVGDACGNRLGQCRREIRIVHSEQSLLGVHFVEGDKNDRPDFSNVVLTDSMQLLPRFEVRAEGSADSSCGQRVSIF